MDHIIQIKDFQGMTAKIEGSIGAFGVGISGEIDTKNDDKISGSVGGGENTRIKVMVSLGYRGVFDFDNLSEEFKEFIRFLTSNPERAAENVEGIKMLIEIIQKAEELKKWTKSKMIVNPMFYTFLL